MVIAIIAILAALLLPTLARAKEKAKQTFCVNNQHPMAVCFQLYTPDCNDWYPLHDGWAAQGGQRPTNAVVTGYSSPLVNGQCRAKICRITSSMGTS